MQNKGSHRTKSSISVLSLRAQHWSQARRGGGGVFSSAPIRDMELPSSRPIICRLSHKGLILEGQNDGSAGSSTHTKMLAESRNKLERSHNKQELKNGDDNKNNNINMSFNGGFNSTQQREITHLLDICCGVMILSTHDD